MHKSHTVLRPLILLFLSGWLGLVAPSAEAQQTVTLSGRVTDTAGQAVSGAYVFLDRLPEGISAGEHYTDGNGAYHFSVSPGRYLLRVRHQPGPLFDPRLELVLSANTTRNVVLEAGVTLSGRVTGPAGQPVPGAWLVFYAADQAIDLGAAITDNSGYYNLGLPAGTYRIDVASEAFMDQSLEGVAVPQNTVLDIALEAGVVLEGTVVDDRGQPVADAEVCAHPPAEQWGAGTCTETESEGDFQLRATPDTVYIVRISLQAPRRLTRHRLEVGREGISDIVLTVSRDPAPFVPDDPPKAALISISSPTADGEVTLRGATGSVAPHSAVVAITLNTGHFTAAQAAADGSFTATLFAPAGASILIKADPVGTSAARFLPVARDDLPTSGEEGGDTGALVGLSGTILRVADPPGRDTPIGSAGRPFGEPVWIFSGSINTQSLAPGDPLRVRGTVRMDSPALQGIDNLRVEIDLLLERLSDTDGSSILPRSTFASTFLTPTGLPIERQPGWDGSLGQYQQVSLVKTASAQAATEIDLTLTLPSDLPAGYYRPFLHFTFPDIPLEDPPRRPVLAIGDVQGAARSSPHEARLPIIRVGNPAPPRLYWPLLLDTLSNGSRGVLAMEDADRFGVAQRILTPSETFVIPRLGAVSGQPLPYRLEPFVPTVGLGNAEFSSPPLIPFRFPSGSLTVRIHQPDGTETVLGPAPFVQARLKGLADEEGAALDIGGGHISNVYQLSTTDPRFDVTFAQDGLHVITVEGTIDDIWGNTWSGGGTYEVHVGRVLALDTAVLPGAHFEVGDGFNPGLVVSPPVTAEVEVRVQHVPHSDISQLQKRVIRGRTNRFGYFQPAGNSVIFEQPGEYRVDITARGQDAQGQRCCPNSDTRCSN